MYKEVLRAADGLALYPVISFIVFFTFFALLLLYVWKMSRQQIKEWEEMPFQDEHPSVPVAKEPTELQQSGPNHLNGAAYRLTNAQN